MFEKHIEYCNNFFAILLYNILWIRNKNGKIFTDTTFGPVLRSGDKQSGKNEKNVYLFCIQN